MKTKNTLAISTLLATTLILGACARQQTRDNRDTAPEADDATSAAAPIAPSAPVAAPAPPAASPQQEPQDQSTQLAHDAHIQFTGIQACDEYLASYKACHSVIGSYAPEQIGERLSMLRATWLEKARDPDQREALEAQCNSVTATMQEALNGRECTLPESDFIEADR